MKSGCQSYVKRFKVLFILFFIWLCCRPLGKSPLEKGAGLIKCIIIHLCLVKRVLGLKMASGTMINYCSSSKRSHVVICYRLALLKKKKKSQIEHAVFSMKCGKKPFQTFLKPTPTPHQSVRQDLSPSLRNFYFGSAIRHESKLVHMYTPARKEELWPLNRHLSIMLASRADRSTTRDAEVRREPAKNQQNKLLEGERVEKTKMKRSKERWDFWSLLEALGDESGAACCLVFLHVAVFLIC